MGNLDLYLGGNRKSAEMLDDVVVKKCEFVDWYLDVVAALEVHIKYDRDPQTSAVLEKYPELDKETKAMAKDYFDKFDLNSDGMITVQEFKSKLSSWGMSDADVHNYIGNKSEELLDDRIVHKHEFYD